MKISNDSLVEFTYSITDQNNNIVEEVEQPVIYVHGRQRGLHGKIETAMEGCRAGDMIKVDLDPDEGFGPVDPKLIITEDIANIPEQFLTIGAETEFQNDRGESKTFRVTKISDGKITFDGNYPLAGQSVTFTLKILDVRIATEAELNDQDTSVPASKPPTLN